MKCKLSDFIEINPKETLSKNALAKKVAMEKLAPYCREISGYEIEAYTGGSKFRNKDTIMARITPCLENGKIAQVNILDKNEVGFGSTEFIVLRAKKDIADPDYIYYLTISELVRIPAIKSMVGSSGRQRVQTDVVENLEIDLPDLGTQKKIAKILSALDDKIECNNQINKNLEEQLYVLYKEISFSKTYNYKTTTVDEFCNIFTGKKNANQFDENGQYMFFTCGEKTLKINSFIYDGPAIIISGNGSYTGRTLFYNGKFDLYQRTYACTLKPNIPKNYIFGLYGIIKFTLHEKIAGGTHGSSIPYIVMNDIAKFEFNLNEREFIIFSEQSKSILTLIQGFQNQNEKLKELRDTLLPKLMSGELDVSDIDI